MSQDSSAKKTSPEPVELDLNVDFADAKLELVSAQEQTSTGIKLYDDSENLLAASLQAAVESKDKIPVMADDDRQSAEAIEIALPKNGLKITSASGESTVIKNNPVQTKSKIEGTKVGLKLAAATPQMAPSRFQSFVSEAKEKFATALVHLKPFLDKLRAPQKPSEERANPLLSKPALVIFAVLALALSIYGYAVNLEYKAGPYSTWSKILKHWKKADVTAIKEFTDFSIDDVPIYIVERYPKLTLTSESGFGTLIKKTNKMRSELYEAEFKKGFGSKFWEFQVQEATSFGDRYELLYTKDSERLIFTLVKANDEWKLVDIDASKAIDIFQLNADALKEASQ